MRAVAGAVMPLDRGCGMWAEHLKILPLFTQGAVLVPKLAACRSHSHNPDIVMGE
jgi:hypothetical protein